MLLPLMLARYAWKLYLDSQSAQSHLITAFIHSLEAKDRYTQGHSARVANYSVEIARQMRLSERKINLLRQGALLHDIGQDRRLGRHPQQARPPRRPGISGHPRPSDHWREHLERRRPLARNPRNGAQPPRALRRQGLSDGVPSGRLSVMTRILCVADAYDAMTSDRPYRKGLPREEALRILRENAGSQFDPAVVEAFICAEFRRAQRTA